MKNKINKNGFTLIELIVSVTIIAVMTVIAVASYTGASRRARDSRRMADLEKIRIALEVYRQAVGTSYPGSLNDLVSTYIQANPVDPKTGFPYTYSPTGYTYTIRAVVEDAGSSNISGGYYQVTNP